MTGSRPSLAATPATASAQRCGVSPPAFDTTLIPWSRHCPMTCSIWVTKVRAYPAPLSRDRFLASTSMVSSASQSPVNTLQFAMRSAPVMGPRLLLLPPSRALRWLREAGPRRRDTATAPGTPYAAFDPPSAVSVADLMRTRRGSISLVDDGQQVAAADLVAWPGADLAQRPGPGRGDPVLHLHGLHDHDQLARGDGVAGGSVHREHRARHRGDQAAGHLLAVLPLGEPGHGGERQ